MKNRIVLRILTKKGVCFKLKTNFEDFKAISRLICVQTLIEKGVPKQL